ncbi:circadian-associated transcriptional repressor [Candoia aspera]|uniref:circadian-associated transcriptional repressor n=1 Tax=Candoia aspera TaxID=51853 RepID=UPI002FD7B4C9
MDIRSISSWESLCSVESTASEEDEEEQLPHPPPNKNFRVFLLDDGGHVGKGVRLPRHRCLNGPGFLLWPGSHGKARKRWVRKPLSPLTSARLRPPGPGCRCSPEVPGEAFCSCPASPNGSLPGQRVSQKRAGGSGGCKCQSLPYPVTLSPRGAKRQRKRERAAEETSHAPCWTEGDRVFAQKCWELQGFVRPLSELLERLKMGRFDRGLSSFQQSVAMDRIQRIIGVLQKPQMGERYLATLLQVEKMLKIWFPHIPLNDSQASCSVSARKACEAAESCYIEGDARGRRRMSIRDAALSPFLDLSSLHDHKAGTQPGELVPVANGPATNVTWIHMSPILNPLSGQEGFSLMNFVPGQILLGPHMNHYGAVFLLQNVTAAQAASEVWAHSSSPLGVPFSGSGEPPRCHSLPSALSAGISAPRGTLGGLSWSLPHLPMSGEELEGSEMSAGKPMKCCSS